MNRFATLALGALALGFAAPLSAQALAPGEIELHIEALGQVGPDSALVPINLVGSGKDQKAAEADLKKKESELLASLAKLGVPRDMIEIAKDDEPRYAVVVPAELAMACADAPAPSDRAVPEPLVVPGDSSTPPGCAQPDAQATRMVMVRVEDLSKLADVSALGGDDNYYGATMSNLYTRDPAAARGKAIADALAKARAEADAYAAAMGYRVVRIVRVSNAKPGLNWPDIMVLIGGIEGGGRSGREEMRAMLGGTYAGAQVDFVIAPK